jgi:hypothetical protein
MKNADKVLVLKSGWKRLTGRHKHSWMEYITTDLKQTGWDKNGLNRNRVASSDGALHTLYPNSTSINNADFP